MERGRSSGTVREHSRRPLALDALGLPRVQAATFWVRPGEPLGHVLVVMDDLYLRRLFRQQIENLGWPVREACSVARALDRVNAVTPQLIVLDPWIEHGAGLRFLEELRARRAADPIPVLLVGEDARPGNRLRGQALGVVGQIPLHQVAEADAWLRLATTADPQPSRPD